MKKNVSETANFLNEKRFKKSIKKSKGKPLNTNILSRYQIKALSGKHYSEFNKFVSKDLKQVLGNVKKNVLKVPKKFSFGSDFDEAIVFFKKLNFVLYEVNKKVVIDFSKCKKMHIGAATLFQITMLEFFSFTDKINKNHYGKMNDQFEIINSKSTRINKMLYGLRMIEEFDGMDEENENSGYLSLGLIVGAKSRSDYRENTKGKIGKKINQFINNSMRVFGFEFNDIGKNMMGNLMGEILGNAEDHSKLNKFYVNGISFMEVKDSPVVELNLAIINLGYSFYEGFMVYREKNSEVIDELERVYDFHSSLPDYNSTKLSKESLFTLYSLQEGISRLKFERESRGNGTMNFIKAFMTLGELGETNKEYQSQLNIISGHTVIDCNNDFKPYIDSNGVYYLSLNKEQDKRKLPSKKAIFTKEGYFPGTILQVRIFMSEEHFMKVS